MPTISPSVKDALASSIWTDEFWDRFSSAEVSAQGALERLLEAEMDGHACACATCMVKVVLETVWPAITDHVQSVVG